MRIECPNCNQRLKIDDSRAGAVATCPACQRKMRIPEVTTDDESTRPLSQTVERQTVEPSPNDDKPAPPKRRRKPIEEDAFLSDLDDSEDHEETDDDEEEWKPTRKRKKKGSQIAWGRVLGGGLMAMVRYTLAAFGLLVVMFITFAIAIHLPGVVMGVGLLVYLIGYLWIIIVPFDDGALTGLLCLFLPFYGLYYLIKNWDKMKDPFLVTSAGLLLIFVGSCAGGGMKPRPRGQRAIPQWQNVSPTRTEVALATDASQPQVG